MSLITRCPACGTMFKVVTDQLKVSQGWVRCGHCSEVFDASVHMVSNNESVPTAAPSPDVPPFVPLAASAPEPSVAPETAAPGSFGAAGKEWAPARSFADRVPLRPSQAAPLEEEDSAADFDPASWKLSQRKVPAPPISSSPAAPPEVAPKPEPSHAAATVDEISSFSRVAAIDPEAAEDTAKVSFVRDAQRKAFWKKPLTRVLLGLLALLLLALLIAQWMIQQRDALAAMQPKLVPLLQVLCAPVRCEIGPPRRIDSLVVDSSTFNRLGADAYRLSFTLKNVDVMPVAMPSMEVTLTDTQDKTVVRRIVPPAQFGATGPTLAALSEIEGVVVMKVSGDATASGATPSPSAGALPLRVGGYRILAFYP